MQLASNARHPVVVQVQRAEAQQLREALQPHYGIVGEIYAVKLVLQAWQGWLFSCSERRAGSPGRPRRWPHPMRSPRPILDLPWSYASITLTHLGCAQVFNHGDSVPSQIDFILPHGIHVPAQVLQQLDQRRWCRPWHAGPNTHGTHCGLALTRSGVSLPSSRGPGAGPGALASVMVMSLKLAAIK